MILLIVDWLTNLFNSWLDVWKSFEAFLRGFATFGLSGAGESVSKYGTEEATPTTRLLGGIYVIAQVAPGLLLTYMLSKRVVSTKVRQIAIGIIGGFVWFGVTSYILGLRPGAREAYHKFAYGPMSVFTAIKEMFAQDPVQAFTVWVVIFGSFFVFSFLMWYMISLFLWVATSYRQKPLFTDTSAKALSLWLTAIWVFYLTLGSAGGAFINTVFFLFVILISRSDYGGGGGSDPQPGEMTYDQSVSANPSGSPEIIEEAPTSPPPPEEDTSSGSSDRLNWVD